MRTEKEIKEKYKELLDLYKENKSVGGSNILCEELLQRIRALSWVLEKSKSL